MTVNSKQYENDLSGSKFPVYEPYFGGKEKQYVNECIDSSWISSKGKFIKMFEQNFALFNNIKYASSTTNGTTAIHLALLALGIGTGDEVIVPTLTFVATVNAVMFVGGKPVFADSLKDTWQIDPKDIERKITSKTKAIIAVHLYGHPCPMDEIMEICTKNKLFLIEDCAEAIGSRYKNKLTGTFGDISTFSFYGNKTITTGEGGMVISNSKELIDKVNMLKDQAMHPEKSYWHEMVAYNYRMTNIAAAIGCAQLEIIDKIIARKTDIAKRYRSQFKNTAIQFHSQSPDTLHTYWMCSILVKDYETRESLRQFLKENNIETRPLFYPIHSLPMYKEFSDSKFPVSDDLSQRGLNIPSYPGLRDEEVDYIAKKILAFIKK